MYDLADIDTPEKALAFAEFYVTDVMTGTVTEAGAKAAEVSSGDLLSGFFSVTISLVQLYRQEQRKAVLRKLDTFLQKGETGLATALKERIGLSGTDVKHAFVDLLKMMAEVFCSLEENTLPLGQDRADFEVWQCGVHGIAGSVQTALDIHGGNESVKDMDVSQDPQCDFTMLTRLLSVMRYDGNSMNSDYAYCSFVAQFVHSTQGLPHVPDAPKLPSCYSPDEGCSACSPKAAAEGLPRSTDTVTFAGQRTFFARLARDKSGAFKIKVNGKMLIRAFQGVCPGGQGDFVTLTQDYLEQNRVVVSTLASLADYNEFETAHLKRMAFSRGGFMTAASFLPLLGAINYVQSYYSLMDRWHKKAKRRALKARVRAATDHLSEFTACTATPAVRDMAPNLQEALRQFSWREAENLAVASTQSGIFAVIHAVSGIATGAAYAFAPMGPAIKIVAVSALKVLANVLVRKFYALRRSWKVLRIFLSTSELFDLVWMLHETEAPGLSDPGASCALRLSELLFDLSPQQTLVLGQRGLVKRHFFTPTVMIPTTEIELGLRIRALGGSQQFGGEIAQPEGGHFGILAETCSAAEPSESSAEAMLRGPGPSSIPFLRIVTLDRERGSPLRRARATGAKRRSFRTYFRRGLATQVRLYDLITKIDGKDAARSPDWRCFARDSTTCHAVALRVTIEAGFRSESRSGCFRDEPTREKGAAFALPPLRPLGAPRSFEGKGNVTGLRKLWSEAVGSRFRGGRLQDCEAACVADPTCWGYEVRQDATQAYCQLVQRGAVSRRDEYVIAANKRGVAKDCFQRRPEVGDPLEETKDVTWTVKAPAKSLGIGIQLLAQGLVVKEVDDDAALNEGLEGDLKVQVGDIIVGVDGRGGTGEALRAAIPAQDSLTFRRKL
jgi:hypothetical protein